MSCMILDPSEGFMKLEDHNALPLEVMDSTYDSTIFCQPWAVILFTIVLAANIT